MMRSRPSASHPPPLFSWSRNKVVSPGHESDAFPPRPPPSLRQVSSPPFRNVRWWAPIRSLRLFFILLSDRSPVRGPPPLCPCGRLFPFYVVEKKFAFSDFFIPFFGDDCRCTFTDLRVVAPTRRDYASPTRATI